MTFEISNFIVRAILQENEHDDTNTCQRKERVWLPWVKVHHHRRHHHATRPNFSDVKKFGPQMS